MTAPWLIALAVAVPAANGSRVRPFPLEVREFRILDERYDPENPHAEVKSYYQVFDDGHDRYIHGLYLPPRDTVTLFHEVPDPLRNGVRRLTWRWRANVLPRKGNECAPKLGDSAANVYVTWKRGMRWYSLKFVWSTEAPVGATCNKIRNPFTASDSIVLRSGATSIGWVEESIDPEALFRDHFAGGDPNAEVPELQGIGLMSDGDQTNSASGADFADFVLYK
jgi:Protein of unknown function (DUF3047)